MRHCRLARRCRCYFNLPSDGPLAVLFREEGDSFAPSYRYELCLRNTRFTKNIDGFWIGDYNGARFQRNSISSSKTTKVIQFLPFGIKTAMAKNSLVEVCVGNENVVRFLDIADSQVFSHSSRPVQPRVQE
jgi:hypothetical protein